MKLWLLKCQNDDVLKKLPNNPWEPWYDKCFSMVVCAETEQEARKLAQSKGRDEMDEGIPDVWTNPEYSTCESLETVNTPGVIIQDVRHS